MFTLAKQMIAEKEVRRKITILETLINSPLVTTKELAQKMAVSQRTVFNDLQSLRLELPKDWELDSDGSNGVFLKTSATEGIQEVWDIYMQQSLSMVVLQALLLKKKIAVPTFLREQGLSYDVLKKQVTKMNAALQNFQLKILLDRSEISWGGEETAIRLFYHRLLVPFTHQHFFFEDYGVHESNYHDFLRGLQRQGLAVTTEKIFGICWFFINTIRIKAGCRVETLAYEEDVLFADYLAALKDLYRKEGINLSADESFFAFFCFLESWSYLLSPEVSELLRKAYPHLFKSAKDFLTRLGMPFSITQDSELLEDLVLFQVKYYESKTLSDKFLMEYAEVLTVCRRRYPQLFESIQETLATEGMVGIESVSDHAVSNLVLLVQTARARLNPQPVKAFLVYQGEPAWKQFLLQELQDLAGRRVELNEISLEELEKMTLGSENIILSNLPINFECSGQIVYLSTIPTANELQQFEKLVRKQYI